MQIVKNYRTLTGQQAADKRTIRVRHAITAMCLPVLSACVGESAEVVAQAKHDFNGNFKLFSYQASPAEDLGQAELIAKKQYGALQSDVKSPSTMFMCLWRDTSYTRLDGDRPAEIFLSCFFAPTPVKASASLLKNAQTFNTIDRVNLKATWKLEGRNYRLSRFDLEILANGQLYRSQNLESDIAQMQVIEAEMAFPNSGGDPFQFNLQAKLPYRQNSGDPQRDPIVSISLSGAAEPIPDWVNY